MPSISTRLDAIGVTWPLRSRDGERIGSHHGNRIGEQSTLTLVPGRNCAITVLTDTNTGVQLGNEVTDWTLERDPGPLGQPFKPVPADLAIVTEFVGTYATCEPTIRTASGCAMQKTGWESSGLAATHDHCPLNLAGDDVAFIGFMGRSQRSTSCGTTPVTLPGFGSAIAWWQRRADRPCHGPR